MTPYHLAPRRTRPIFEYSPEGAPVEVVLRRFPVTRWTAWAATGGIYHLWTHETLGWWVRSDALTGPMRWSVGRNALGSAVYFPDLERDSAEFLKLRGE